MSFFRTLYRGCKIHREKQTQAWKRRFQWCHCVICTWVYVCIYVCVFLQFVCLFHMETLYRDSTPTHPHIHPHPHTHTHICRIPTLKFLEGVKWCHLPVALLKYKDSFVLSKNTHTHEQHELHAHVFYLWGKWGMNHLLLIYQSRKPVGAAVSCYSCLSVCVSWVNVKNQSGVTRRSAAFPDSQECFSGTDIWELEDWTVRTRTCVISSLWSYHSTVNSLTVCP